MTRFAPRLYDFLARLSGRTEAADALLRQAASQAAMGANSAAQWPSERAWFFSRAFAVLPSGFPAEAADLAVFATPDRAQLPSGDDAATEAMSRAVWRAVSALPHDQHALLHLRVREAMVPGEAASVLGVTEREASDRLGGLTAAVEETSRALFLLRHGRAHDATLNELLAGRDANRLTPELRTFLRDYMRDSPTVRAMLAPVPPLAVYASFAPLAIPPALSAEATEAALPWLSTGRAAAVPVAPVGATTTAMLPEQEATAVFDSDTTGVLPEGASSAATAFMGAASPPGGYAPPGAASGQPPFARIATPAVAQPGATATSGTQMLSIPVRQRIVPERGTAVRPPVSARRGVNPLAIIGGLAGALVVIVGALVVFLSGAFGSANANVRTTATIGGTPALGGSATTTIPDVLLTSTAIAENRILTTTAQAGTPTPLPTQVPQPVVRPPVAPEPSSSAAVPSMPATSPTATGTPEPRVTLAPTFAPAPPVAPEARTTLAPPIPPRDPIAVSTTASTRPATSVATAARTVVSTAALSTAPTAAATTAATAAPAMPTTAPTRAATSAATSAATTAPTMPAAAATPTVMRTAAATAAAATMPMSSSVTASTTFLIVSMNPSGSVTLMNKGTAATNFTASASGRGVSVSPASGTIGANGSTALTVTINRAGIPMGNYGGNVVVTTDSGSVMIIISYAVQ